jgi:hypothetical protein
MSNPTKLRESPDGPAMLPGFGVGVFPENWLCVDCGFNTAPGIPGRVEIELTTIVDYAVVGDAASFNFNITHDSEIYTVTEKVWKRAGMEPWGGCLCIGCLEMRIGRRLKPKDFMRDDPWSHYPGSSRLLNRRGLVKEEE